MHAQTMLEGPFKPALVIRESTEPDMGLLQGNTQPDISTLCAYSQAFFLLFQIAIDKFHSDCEYEYGFHFQLHRTKAEVERMR